MDSEEKNYDESKRFFDIAHSKIYNIPAIYNTWYKAKDAGELNFLIKWFSSDVATIHGQKKLEVGEWFTVTLEYLPDNTWSREFITFERYKKLVTELLKDFKNIKEEDL